jgi:hypothetical protein
MRRNATAWAQHQPASTARQSAATSCRWGSCRAARGAARLADVVVAVQRGETQQAARDAHGGETGVAGGRERPAVVHGRADHKACRHTIVEQVNTAFRRMGLIFPLEAEGDNPDWATIWLTGVGMPAAA